MDARRRQKTPGSETGLYYSWHSRQRELHLCMCSFCLKFHRNNVEQCQGRNTQVGVYMQSLMSQIRDSITDLRKVQSVKVLQALSLLFQKANLFSAPVEDGISTFHSLSHFKNNFPKLPVCHSGTAQKQLSNEQKHP